MSSAAIVLTPKAGAIHAVLVNAFFRGLFCPDVASSLAGERAFNLRRFMDVSFRYRYFPNQL